ncbi:hypothetical protein [Methanosarcina horonobensis]|nr:hypothetical protein [Methanosarcina horonobensis]
MLMACLPVSPLKAFYVFLLSALIRKPGFVIDIDVLSEYRVPIGRPS